MRTNRAIQFATVAPRLPLMYPLYVGRIIDMNIYDKSKWHTEGNFPSELSAEQASVHIGYFFGWVASRGMLSEQMIEDFPEEIAQFREGIISAPRLFRITGSVLDDQLLGDEAISITSEYYKKKFIDDYLDAFPETDSVYHIVDTPENFDRVKSFLDRSYSAWKKSKQ